MFSGCVDGLRILARELVLSICIQRQNSTIPSLHSHSIESERSTERPSLRLVFRFLRVCCSAEGERKEGRAKRSFILHFASESSSGKSIVHVAHQATWREKRDNGEFSKQKVRTGGECVEVGLEGK